MKYTRLNIALLLLISVASQGQISLQSDTISIGEVVISGKKSGSALPGFKMNNIDSAILKISDQQSLADLLSQHSSVFIKSYGMGGSATPSFRGTGAGHTQLTWNDINLNSPMLGQSDFSLIPVGMVDAVQICYGGASMNTGNGGIGGTINIATNPVWRKGTMISVNPAMGSFGQYGGLLKARTGNSGFQSVTKAFYQYGKNNFPYLNSVSTGEPVWEKRSNSQVAQRGFIQEFYLKRDKNVTSARVWYEAADRNLASSMLVQQAALREKQYDESLRAMMNFIHAGNLSRLSLTGAWIMNRLDYTNSLAEINSRNRSQSFVLKGGMERDAGNSLRLKIYLDDQINLINSNNYEGKKSRNTLNLTTSAEKKLGSHFDASILVRETLDRNTMLLPDFSTGLQFRPIAGKDYFFRTNISRNSRIPSMNDLFWLPGGNTDLKNEYAFMYELTGEINRKFSLPLNFKADLTYFRNNIRDMIQWHPGEFSYWSADNIRSVNTSGIESSLNLDFNIEKFKAGLIAGYTYTRASTTRSHTNNDASVGKQLIYVPAHQANSTILAGYGKFYSSWILVFTGQRYITSDNTDYLPPYLLNNLLTGVRLNYRENLLDIKFQIDNIFNISYQAIAYYPMPGRSYSLKLLFQFLR